MTGADTAGLDGLFTIACFQANRVEQKNRLDIESYYYFNRFFDALPLFLLGRGFDDNEYIEDVLLLKGWRRYTWQSITQYAEQGMSDTLHKLALKGQVFRNNKMLRKPVKLVMMRDTVMEMFATDENGSFTLNPGEVAVTENRKMFYKIGKEDNYGYQIVSSDTLEKTMQQLAGRLPFYGIVKPVYLQTNDTQWPAGEPKVKRLQEVVVTGQKAHTFLFKKTNACGDYICMNRVLNCPNHPEPFDVPVKGRFYFAVSGNTVIETKYEGCALENDPLLAEISIVYSAREFYGMDSILLQQTTPEYMSTIFWQPFVTTHEKGRAGVSFYTSDIKGEFRITVQGIGNNGELIFSEKQIKVE